jgi:hypothetical protein
MGASLFGVGSAAFEAPRLILASNFIFLSQFFVGCAYVLLSCITLLNLALAYFKRYYVYFLKITCFNAPVPLFYVFYAVTGLIFNIFSKFNFVSVVTL